MKKTKKREINCYLNQSLKYFNKLYLLTIKKEAFNIVATIDLYYDFGGSDNNPGTEQDTDALGPPQLRFKQADDATIDTVAPIPIPAAGTEYSRWKQIYLYCAAAPDTQIDNLKFYTDGTGFGTGITVNVGDEFPVKNSGANTGYDVSDANEIMTEHTDITGVTDAFDYTTGGSELAGPSISEAGNIINAIGETSNYLVLQMTVESTASPGDLANETFVIQYDEI